MKFKLQNFLLSDTSVYEYNIHETLHRSIEIHGQGFNHRDYAHIKETYYTPINFSFFILSILHLSENDDVVSIKYHLYFSMF